MNRATRVACVTSLLLVTGALTASVGRRPTVFPLSDVRFWSTTGFVTFMWVVVALALLAALRKFDRVLVATVAVPAGLGLGVAMTGSLEFPSTRSSVWGLVLLITAAWLLVNGRVLLRSRTAVGGVLFGALLGALHLTSMKPGDAHTQPHGGTLTPSTFDATSSWHCGSARLELVATLAFQATSRDGFWPGTGPRDELEGEPHPQGAEQRASIQRLSDGVDVVTVLPHDVHSHLNRFTDLRLFDAWRPRLRFDATNTTHDFEPFDFPSGRPAHFAYVRNNQLIVARGTDAEKGPFIELARGSVTDPLTLTFFDGETALCRVTFDDFLSQADTTTLSPTAGENVSTNVIQFGVPGTGGAPMVHLSLAETGIGAGLMTVTHRAGTYRNRVHVTELR